jgi:hypothetical protein
VYLIVLSLSPVRQLSGLLMPFLFNKDIYLCIRALIN